MSIHYYTDIISTGVSATNIVDTNLLKQSIFNLQTYIRLQKGYLEESVHVMLFKREVSKGAHKDQYNHKFVTSINL